MLTCIRATWKTIVLPFICIFTFNKISAASLRRYESDSHILEPGFDLTEEDMTKFHIWPRGTIPYYIDDFSFDKVLRDRIRAFLDGVNRLTSLHFVEIPKPPEDEETRWVLFINRKGLLGCADHSFKKFTNKGVQRIVLGYHCMNSDENLAEIVLSLVGVPPQHNAPDRDERVDIMEENIIPDKLHLFEKLKNNEWLFHNLSYDFESTGHYGPYKHTSNGKITVQRKPNDYYHIFVFGPPPPGPKEKGFSSKDILKIAMLYNYILRNRETPVPQCSKLFAQGSKLPVKAWKDMDVKIEPRPKPSLYLGESEREEVNNKEENDNEENNNDEQMSDDTERNDDKEMISENEINEKNTTANTGGSFNQDENYSKDDNNGDGDRTGSEDEENKKKLKANNDMSKYDSEEKLNNSSKTEDVDDEKSIDMSDREGNKSMNENDTTSDSIVNTTSKNNRMRLAHKIFNPLKHKLLIESDYESDKEGKNKYTHEKNL